MRFHSVDCGYAEPDAIANPYTQSGHPEERPPWGFQLREDRDAGSALPFYGNGRRKFRVVSLRSFSRDLSRANSPDFRRAGNRRSGHRVVFGIRGSFQGVRTPRGWFNCRRFLHRSARNILVLNEKSKTTCASENGHVSAPSLFSQARLRTANCRFGFH
jgi:hypothetical protein